jgi:energy-converting hydrogenase Eha subunit G
MLAFFSDISRYESQSRRIISDWLFRFSGLSGVAFVVIATLCSIFLENQKWLFLNLVPYIGILISIFLEEIGL